jgi:glucose-6-phosphate isomerase
MLAGCDSEAILKSAISATEVLSRDDDRNPGLILGAAIARSANGQAFKDKLGFVPSGSSIVSFGDWVEQLIAESTGKQGRGVLPVVLESNSMEVKAGFEDLLLIGLADDADTSDFDVAVSGDLGEQMLAWEVATAVASRLLEVNPFDQPDVESAKIAARALLESPADGIEYSKSASGIEFASLGFELRSSDLGACLSQLASFATEDSYFSIHCYLNREQFADAEQLRELLAQRTNRPTTFGWGPRFLHSTGQYHKGGPKQGVFLQIVSGNSDDLVIPGRDFGYRQLIDSQASGDAKVLFAGGSKVLVLRLSNLDKGIRDLIGALS